MTKPIIKPVFDKAPGNDIFKKIQQEVRQNVLSNKAVQQRNVLKAVVYVLLLMVAYTGILTLGNHTGLLFLFYIVFGFSMILIFINSFHDAAHGALFDSKKMNQGFCYILELFGSNNFIWKKRHLLLHHPYPNVPNWDIDVKQSDIARIFPTAHYLKVHKYQHIYMWFLYPMYTLNWLFLRDFKDFFGKKDNYLKRVTKIPRVEYFKLFGAKLFNIFYLIVIPAMVLNQSVLTILSEWFAMHLVSSCFGTIALLSTHVDEHAHFPETAADGRMNTTWFMHQLNVTKDFSADSPLALWLFGGFTHHVAHHLFPGIGNTYYPEITKVIRRYSKEYDLPYHNYPFYAAIKSHFRLLKNNGRENNLFRHGEL